MPPIASRTRRRAGEKVLDSARYFASGGTSPARSAIGRAWRTSDTRNLPASSVIGKCAEFSNQTNCFDGATTFANHSAATAENYFAAGILMPRWS